MYDFDVLNAIHTSRDPTELVGGVYWGERLGTTVAHSTRAGRAISLGGRAGGEGQLDASSVGPPDTTELSSRNRDCIRTTAADAAHIL